MSREIKFRVWDKYNKRMLAWMYPVDCWLRWLNGEDKEIEVMQFTGLRDKNGKEIYGGDIVKHNDYGQISIVEWSEGDWGWYMRGVEHWNPKTQFDSSKDEVIGNIYENPELLKGGKE